MSFDDPGDAEVAFPTSEMINPLLIAVETSSNITSSRYVSAESSTKSSTADHFTHIKALDETNMIGDEKTINPHLRLLEK